MDDYEKAKRQQKKEESSPTVMFKDLLTQEELDMLSKFFSEE